MSKCLDPFRFLLISLAGWMNQQWPASPARSSRVVVTAATLVSVMNGWHAGAMRRVHGFAVSCLIRGVSGALASSSSEVSDGDATLGWPWDSADRVFGPYGGADLVVIGRHTDDSILGRLTTHAYAIVRESPCPVLSV